ncbi:ribonuclease domain-containing protein [Pseudoxanthomonas wuyuanensis]|uniref:Guanyl-specific ribonuclease Sa n=1 Tax=Pseudoxanthomonas wuyuanensis TaxID=1073196 RepID=A0A286CX99_9GAMM|nr:ribonuclease domain-containing protein [Pseudoxanthomonas wuyuanensis]KAF1720851.1 ribonuclease [Pseudoxanthomonas wuyuanensis]SOD50984.1 Guanyl-specific ribonuclease Sa [Pseudoxanthomonas wuyuanensis]
MPLRSRSRKKTGSRKPLLIVIALLVLLGGWFWHQRSQIAENPEAPPDVSIPETSTPGGATRSQPLPLPPQESPEPVPARPPESGKPSGSAFLPAEAHDTLRLIAGGGPFPHRQDGGVFGNREGRLPAQPRGFYREYTVATPALNHRGARRIVTGGQPPQVYYYTDDHYESFRRFDWPAQGTP